MANVVSKVFTSFITRNTQTLTRITGNIKNKFNVSRIATQKSNELSKKLFKIEKPKNFDDYHNILNFLISKKICNVIFIMAVALSVWYLFFVFIPDINLTKNLSKKLGIASDAKECYYDSKSIKKYTGLVRVSARKNKAVYVGNLENGLAAGVGTLYRENGKLIYKGNFKNNHYNGKGILYYENGTVKYSGDFLNNVPNGKGTLNLESGKKIYDGTFLDNKKNGIGVLYNSSEEPIYNGSFRNDFPNLTIFLGSNSDDLPKHFSGKKIIYNHSNKSLISYPETGCAFVIERSDTSLNSGGVVTKVFVLPPNLYAGMQASCNKIELSNIIPGNYIYGYTKVTPMEMCVIDAMRNANLNKFKKFSDVLKEYILDEVIEIKNTKFNDEIYVSKYSYDNLIYTFYFKELNQKYNFYSIERLD